MQTITSLAKQMHAQRPLPRNDIGMRLRGMGSFHVGGYRHSITHGEPRMVQLTQTGHPALFDPNGTYMIGQMYVQYFLPDPHQHNLPLLMWHGGGLTGACWETTPDGRPGFRDIFLAGGWDVFVSDAVERGRSGFAPVPDVWGPPISQTIETVFERFRIGAYLPKGELARASQHVYPGTAFPVEALDRFAAQMVPRWTNTNGYILDAYLEELEATGPAVILAHSQGCVFALEAAARRPDLVAALVLLEPAAIPELPASFIAADLPMLVMLGDFIERSKRWMKMQRDITRFVSCNDHAELLQLPEHGLEGNSHMLMMDRTSDKVAELIMNWLAKQELSV